MPALAALASDARLAAFERLRARLDARGAGGVARPAGAGPLATGLPGVDEPLGGGLPRGALTELVFAAPSSGGQLLLLHLLQAARRRHRFLALVDGADGFDPQTIEPSALLRHLLWVRCAGAAQAMQAADLIARDSNFALLALDLRGCAARELRRTPATTWYRLQRVVEPADTVLAVLTPRRLVPAAHARLQFSRPLPLTALAMEQTDLAEQLAPAVDRLRTGGAWNGERAAAPAPERARRDEASLGRVPIPPGSAPYDAPDVDAADDALLVAEDMPADAVRGPAATFPRASFRAARDARPHPSAPAILVGGCHAPFAGILGAGSGRARSPFRAARAL